LCEQTEIPAIMNIDDFGVHLDESRKGLCKNALQNLLQVFITTPTPLLEWENNPYTRLFVIEEGSVSKKESL